MGPHHRKFLTLNCQLVLAGSQKDCNTLTWTLYQFYKKTIIEFWLLFEMSVDNFIFRSILNQQKTDLGINSSLSKTSFKLVEHNGDRVQLLLCEGGRHHLLLVGGWHGGDDLLYLDHILLARVVRDNWGRQWVRFRGNTWGQVKGVRVDPCLILQPSSNNGTPLSVFSVAKGHHQKS